MRFPRKRRPKQGLDGNVQRKRHHFLRHIALISIPPTADVRPAQIHHRRRVFRNSATVERGLLQTPLPPPEIPFADQQPVPEHAPGNFFA